MPQLFEIGGLRCGSCNSRVRSVSPAWRLPERSYCSISFVRLWRKEEIQTGPIPDSAKSKESPFETPMITSKLSSRGQTTIPLAVRAALDLKKGDEIAYDIKENLIILTKASTGPVHNPFVTFDEWESEADNKAYANLKSG
jgi:antitoxin PrlF